MSLASVKRAYQVLATALHHGLDKLLPARLKPWWFSPLRACLFWLQDQHPDKPAAEKVKLAMQSLGAVHIKFGQMLSTRRDLLDDDWAEHLSQLQDQVPPFDSQLAIEAIEQQLGAGINSLFDEFDPKPLASASISQVHTAKLKHTEAPVVLKILRPNVEKSVKADIELMQSVAKLGQALLPDAHRLRLVEVVEDYRQTIMAELDLRLEAVNATKLRNNFIDSPALYIPRIYPEFSRERLLVMERINGIPVTDIPQLKAQGTNFKLLAERGVEVFFTQVFRDNFFHADMHPGNIFVSRETPEDPQYIGIDCGIVGQLSEEDKRYLAGNFLAFFNQDYKRIAQLYIRSGWVSSSTDIGAFEAAIEEVCRPLADKPLAEISFGQVLLDLFKTARRFDIVVQPQLVLLQKTLLYVEGLGRQLYPQLDLWATAKPFLEEWMKSQTGLKATADKLGERLPEFMEKLPEMPDLIYDNLKMGQNLLTQQKQLLARYLEYKRQQHKSYFLLAVSGVLVICASVLSIQEGTLGPAIALAVISGVFALWGWFSRPSSDKL
ncbi:ubiquinone biosynthesis regulatory protein kinase UbiB [Paraferrimonas sedimenticola]|uniref:ABC1 atypical kinase-like domain-containing protein n=1 Tax=Paraferrimonas sedimenticola TaxID=375674 RepID=A0AA37VZ56_9GAMM|nr:ubiquinone biosynthesis regulatory protein kinase UbiB [Paraferrimonas sedimenticola]GLP97436.1 putative protein kinase UbiB [Paraferrimonas sedimenticola]